MKHNGFMLMEFLVYITLLTIIMLSLSGLVGKLWIPAMHLTHAQTCLINITAAHDLLVQDITIAKAEKNYWKYITPHAIIFKSGWQDIGWVVEDKNLIRIVGTYDETEKKWIKKTKNLLVKAIDTVFFQVMEKKEEIEHIAFTFRQEEYEVSNDVALLNRTLSWKIKK